MTHLQLIISFNDTITQINMNALGKYLYNPKCRYVEMDTRSWNFRGYIAMDIWGVQ